MKEQFDLESLLPQQKKCFERISSRLDSPNDFPASSNRYKYTVAYSAIPTTLASVETDQEIMIFMDQKKKGPAISGKTKETKVI